MPNVTQKTQISKELYRAYSSQERRRKLHADNFLLITKDGNRKFPVKNLDGKFNKELVVAAIASAERYNYTMVAKEAARIYDKYFKDSDPTFDFSIQEHDAEGKEIFGIVLEPDYKDADGHVFDAITIQEACYEYNSNFSNTAYRHTVRLNKNEVTLVESYTAPTDFKLNDKEVKKGTWLQRWLIHDENIRKDILTNKIVGFSIGGYLISE
ncbi:MAG TPA: XkdF-like putative serine protease domain-containing protein [Clostridia bacterium]|nr:XkdF-like putative serine protease domain-containing protein [Clostridia bacterium]